MFIPADDWAVPTAPVLPRAVSTELRAQPDLLEQVGAALAERHQARVYVAPMSGRCGFPEDHPLFAGFLPAMREHIVHRLALHDLILAVGAAAFRYHVEGFGLNLPEGATLCQLTEDPQTAAWAPSGTAVVGSIRLSLQDLLARPAPPAPGERLSVAYLPQTLAGLRSRSSVVEEEAPSARSSAMARRCTASRPCGTRRSCSCP